MPAKKKLFHRRSVRILAGFLTVLLALIIYFAIVAIDRPPQVPDRSSLQIKRKVLGTDSYSFGNNWIRKSESGLWEMYIEGSPFERGVAFGQLTRELFYYQESCFFNQIRVLVPSDNYLRVLKYFTAFFNRNLDISITDEYKKEIYGTSFACNPEFDFIGTGYQRQLNYHAAHDIGHAFQGLNLVACTSFSVWDSKSADSSLLIGRNFDFYMGDQFAENKIVCFVNPLEGYKFMMVTWPDLIGVVSGMNEKGLTVTLNASRSSVPTGAATPVTLLAREILQYASNISEAYAIAKRRKLFVSESLMIGSAKDHRTAIIEKSPKKTALVQSASKEIFCSNHFQSKAFENDKYNIQNIKGSDSYQRYQRIKELTNRYDHLDVSDVAAILRNQLVNGDLDAGMGNQLSVNQLIAHHSVIFKPDSLIVWVSTSPWQLGKYVAYDLQKVFHLKPSDISKGEEIYNTRATIPADTFLNSPKFRLYTEFRNMNKELREFTKDKRPLPNGFKEKYISTNPQYYNTYVTLAAYYEEMKDYPAALKYYSLARTKILPGLDESDKLKLRSEKISKKIKNVDPKH